MQRLKKIAVFLLILPVCALQIIAQKDERDKLRELKEKWNSLREKIIILQSRGEWQNAIEAAEESLRFAKEEFGRKHTNTAISLNDMARVYIGQKKYREAKDLVEKAIGIFIKKPMNRITLYSERILLEMLNYKILLEPKRDEAINKIDQKTAGFALKSNGYIEISGGSAARYSARIDFESEKDKVIVKIDNSGGYFRDPSAEKDQPAGSTEVKLEAKQAASFFALLAVLLDNPHRAEWRNTPDAAVRIYLPLESRLIDISWSENEGEYNMDSLLEEIENFVLNCYSLHEAI